MGVTATVCQIRGSAHSNRLSLFSAEKNEHTLKGTLPDNYFSLLNLDASKLAVQLDTINNIDTVADQAEDAICRDYEYFLR